MSRGNKAVKLEEYLVGRALSWVLTQEVMFQVCGILHCVRIDLLQGFS